MDPAAINMCIGCTVHQTLKNQRAFCEFWIHVSGNWGFVLYHLPCSTMWVFGLLCSPWILCQIPIVSRVRVLMMRDSYISLHSSGLRMLKRWGKRDLGLKEQEKQNEEDELLYFFHSKLVRVTAAFQAMSLFGLGRWGRPFTILAAHLSCVSYVFYFVFLGVFFYVFYKVGRNTTHKVSSRHMMQWWYYLHYGWWVLDT